MNLETLLVSEAGLTMLGAVAGAVWTLFKTMDWYARGRRRRFEAALRALEAGVERTYRTYVQALKEANADGRLTEEERRRARELARETAILYGRTEGVDVLHELGEAYLDLWIAKLVKRLKTA
jgi:uncharacterized membrane protein YebE (DUF533 family)